MLAIAQQDPAVQRANGVLTVHMGPHEIVAGLSIEFEDHLTAPEIEACVERIEARLKKEMPRDHAAVRQAADDGNLGAAAQGPRSSRRRRRVDRSSVAFVDNPKLQLTAA